MINARSLSSDDRMRIGGDIEDQVEYHRQNLVKSAGKVKEALF